MKILKGAYFCSVATIVLLASVFAKAENLNSTNSACQRLRMERWTDSRFVDSIFNQNTLRSYIQKKEGLKSVWPHAQLCTGSMGADQVLKLTLAFSGPIDSVSWGWNYCQVEVKLKRGLVAGLRELRCDSPMDR